MPTKEEVRAEQEREHQRKMAARETVSSQDGTVYAHVHLVQVGNGGLTEETVGPECVVMVHMSCAAMKEANALGSAGRSTFASKVGRAALTAAMKGMGL